MNFPQPPFTVNLYIYYVYHKMKLDVNGMVVFLKNPRNLALLFIPVLGFIMLHLALEKLGYDPLPLLPIVGVIVGFFYSYYLTMWLKERK